jgi:hypothetical protein
MERRCPECGGAVEEKTYVDVANRRVETGVRCASCKMFWQTVAGFDRYCQVHRVHAQVPQKICKVCGKDVQHRLDSAWRGLDPGGPGMCTTCCVCTTCGSCEFRFEAEAAEVRCQVCGAHWASAAEFEAELLGKTWELGLGGPEED